MGNYIQDLQNNINRVKTKNDDVKNLYEAVSKTAMDQISGLWKAQNAGRRAGYLSAEFLIGRVVYANLYNLGLLEQTQEIFRQNGIDPNRFEEVDDAALGNGGLGRLAACFLDSAATHNIPLDGYGIRYHYGLFKQYFRDGLQCEEADNWLRFGDPWSVRCDSERVRIKYADQEVWAVPYDMPIIGYGGKTVNTLRLWQSEPVSGFNFQEFNNSHYSEAYANQTEAFAISSVLYPNDETERGKRLRLKQQYFFTSATIQDLTRKFKSQNQNDLSGFADAYTLQLNDTHPAIAIPELLRILISEEGMNFEKAFDIVKNTFAYTNHTVMQEAMEKWDVSLFAGVVPEVYPYVVMIQNHLRKELEDRGIDREKSRVLNIVDGNQIHMARMSIYGTKSTNGVAALHTEILKSKVLKDWYELFPERFSNKTNGITQRRWLGLCNPELSRFITERIGDAWITNLDELKRLESYVNDPASLSQFVEIKKLKKQQLANHIRIYEYGYELNTDSILDIQVKRLHEYKRQLLNAFSILDIYFRLKDGSLENFAPMTFIFGAKAAPGYKRAKGIIKFINEIGKRINSDPDTKDKLQLLFVQNYNVSYAEKLIPAADISEQISTAGTEASGTGNMKLMLNGAVTLGTYDGANVEIVEQSGEENNFIFGAKVEDINALADGYNPRKIYEQNPNLRCVMDTLVDGTFSDNGTGIFRELFDSLLDGASWHKPDQYYLLLDFDSYVKAKLKANAIYQNREQFAKMCLINTANAGKFSSDRTILEYAKGIWKL